MTTQIGNRVIFSDQTYYTYSDPFSAYIYSLKVKERPSFASLTTANHLGYSAVYEIRGDKLYMINFAGDLKVEKGKYYSVKTVGIEEMFQGQKEVFVSWFSGGLSMQTEDQAIKEDRNGSTYNEDELYILCENGIVKTISMVNSKVLDRISSLEGQLWYLQHHGKKKTIWFHIGRKFARKREYRR